MQLSSHVFAICMIYAAVGSSNRILSEKSHKLWLFMALRPFQTHPVLQFRPVFFGSEPVHQSCRDKGVPSCHMFGTLGLEQPPPRPENEEAHAAQNHQHHILGVYRPKSIAHGEVQQLAVSLGFKQHLGWASPPPIKVKKAKPWGRKTPLGKRPPSCSRHSCPDHDSGWPAGVAVAFFHKGKQFSCRVLASLTQLFRFCVGFSTQLKWFPSYWTSTNNLHKRISCFFVTVSTLPPGHRKILMTWELHICLYQPSVPRSFEIQTIHGIVSFLVGNQKISDPSLSVADSCPINS